MNVDYKNRLTILKVTTPPQRGGTVNMVSSPKELVDFLKEKEGIL